MWEYNQLLPTREINSRRGIGVRRERACLLFPIYEGFSIHHSLFTIFDSLVTRFSIHDSRFAPVTCHLAPVTCHLSPITAFDLFTIYQHSTSDT
jgi:hypothetical protein